MLSSLTTVLLSSLATSVAATGILLPLYVYPSAVWNDGAANWKPAFDAISAHPALPWLVVVNPGNGPGSTYQPGNSDQNYITGVSKLNGYNNVKTIGYVRTDYAASPMDELKRNITAWSNWSTYTGADLAVDGIFFDETTTANFNYLSEAITFTRSTFKKPVTTICNFGAKAGAEFYNICDVVIAFESYLNHPSAPKYQSQTTLKANIPAGYESKAAVIVHHFTGTAADGRAANVDLLNDYIDVISENDVEWCWFTSADYNDITTGPATVGNVANAAASTL